MNLGESRSHARQRQAILMDMSVRQITLLFLADEQARDNLAAK